jgi:hypothetical protein
MADLYAVNRASEWARSATITATSSASGYPATNAGTDDLQSPWWATSGTATLTVTLGASRTVTMVALIGTNTDDLRAITVGGLTGVSLTGSRDAAGAPVDLVATFAAQTATAVTFAISGNSVNWSVARVIVANADTLPNFLDGFVMEPFRPQYSDENDFGNTIRYDLGVTRWRGKGSLILTAAQMATLQSWWASTKAGFYPTIIAPGSPYPPQFARFAMGLPRTHHSKYLKVDLEWATEPYVEVT